MNVLKSTTGFYEGGKCIHGYQHIRAIGACEAVQGLSDQCSIRLQNLMMFRVSIQDEKLLKLTRGLSELISVTGF